MKGQRTGMDFSAHELIITKQDGLLIHWLKIPDRVCQNIKFINTNDIMVVTGDYNSWLFCREFHPSAKGSVSDGYWCEKLTLDSSQGPMDYDPAETKKELEERLNHPEEPLDDDTKEYYEQCIERVEEELDYTHYAYRNMPGWMDSENVVHCKNIKPQLMVVFDAFEEICRRIKEMAEAVPQKEGAAR